jgi:hypothetical protein
VKLNDEARTLLEDHLTAPAYLVRLAEAKCYGDAFQLLAHGLDKQKAVWWACLCLWSQSRPSPPAAVDAVLQVAVRWVLEPREENRQAAAALADPLTPAGNLAQALLYSGGSMVGPESPVVPPPPLLTARMVAATVLLASLEGDPLQIDRRSRLFLRLGGIDLPHGTNRTPQETPTQGADHHASAP